MKLFLIASQELCILLSCWLEFLIWSLFSQKDGNNGEFIIEVMMNFWN